MVLLNTGKETFIYSLLWLTSIVSIKEVNNQVLYAFDGDTILLKCSFTAAITTTWSGPPGNFPYFIDSDINPSVNRRERLSVVENGSSKAYSLQITNLKRNEDEGFYTCTITTDNGVLENKINLKFYIDVHNVSLIPSVNPLAIREGTKREVRCVTNLNAVPVPAITWYLGSTDITSRAGTEITSIIITGNRTENTKTLECRATNSNKPQKTASTILNVEYTPKINTLSQQVIIEGRDLSVTCTATPGNPSSTTFYWTKVANSGFKQNGPTLQMPNILRTSTGTYRCTAENSYSNGERGTDSQSMVINVLYPPIVKTLSQQDIIEGENLSVTCQSTPGNPSSTTFFWTKVDNLGFRQNGGTLQLPNIQRTSSGTYRCTAENNYNNGKKGSDSQSMVVNVLYPPTVNTLSQQDIIEGDNLSVTCQGNPGNPSATTFYWTKVDNPGFRQNSPILQIPNIQRTSYGTYRCTAENNYSNGEKGTFSQSLFINVLYPPIIENRPLQIVNESDTITFTRNISSNPLSNVSWYSNMDLLKTQTATKTTTFTIGRAVCIDTQNFTLVVRNGVGKTVTAVVELIVNCKPMPDKTNITLGVTFTTGIEFSTTIIAYPEPLYELEYENGARNNQMMNNITRNAVNNFTVFFRQPVVDQSSFGLYYLTLRNLFGESTVIVNVIEQRTRRPESPRNIAVVCEITQARVQWISSFNGGDQQYFTVMILNGQDGTNLSYRFHEKGENELHAAHISNLQPLVTYWFVVSAKNSYGSSPSVITRCKTVQEIASSKTGVVAGSVGGVLVLITIVLILGIVIHRRYTCICNIAIEKKDRNTTVETNKDASNYSTIQEQQEHTERNMYDVLTSTENANQYEDILKKDNNGYDEKLNEKLCSVDKDNEANSSKQRIPLKIKDSKDDKFITQNAEEYANTTFIE